MSTVSVNPGVAAAVNPLVPEAQHVALLSATRWAQAEEHARLRMDGAPRGAYKCQGVGILAQTLSSFPAASTVCEQRFPAFAAAVGTLEEMVIQGWHSGADGAYWQRCCVDLQLRDRRGRLISMADANKHASVNSSAIEELLVRMSQFLPRSYTSRDGCKAMQRRVTALASDAIVEEIVGLMIAKITDEQKALLIAASARASDQVLASGDALIEAAKAAGLSMAQIAAGVKAAVTERPLPAPVLPLQAQIAAYIQTLKGFQLTSNSGRAALLS